jgi:ribosomal protein S18 acetylase RimI-like enzyme
VTVTLRPVLPGDEEFTFAVYAATRTDEMALVDWTVMEKEAFLRMQFNAQYQYYTENYPGAQFQVILLGGQPVGRLYIHRRKNEIRIMDIALLPEYRRRGIGSTLLKEILGEAEKDHLSVTIHVERFNPAMHWYERLGFHLVEDKGVYCFLKWSPVEKEQTEHAGQTAKHGLCPTS